MSKQQPLDFSVTQEDKTAAANKFGTVPVAITCMIMQAFEVTAASGSVGLQLDLKTMRGDSVRHVFYTWSGKNNEVLQQGIHDVKDLVMLLELPSCQPAPNTTVDVYDFDLKANVKKRATAYPALHKKKVGVAFDIEEYNGKLRPVAKMFYHPTTRQNITEFLRGYDPVVVDKLMAKLTGSAATESKKTPALNEFDDDEMEEAVNNLTEDQKNIIREKLPPIPADDFDDDIPF